MQAFSHIQRQKYNHFFGNISQKNLQKNVDPGIEMWLAPGQEEGGNETHSHLERARTPTRTTLGIFIPRKKST